MIDVVIPLGWGSHHKNEELRFSLRSLAKNIAGIRNIIIVTDLSGMPPFIKDVIHIPCPDKTNIPSYNTYQKILKACFDKRVSNEFLLHNDDFIIQKKFYASTFPYYHKGTIENAVNYSGSHKYKVAIKNTAILLKKLKKPLKHFGIHCPMLIEKENFVDVNSFINWPGPGGYLTRSLYGNILELKSTLHADNMLNRRLTPSQFETFINKKDFFAIFDPAANKELWQNLSAIFPEKSPWEK